MYEASFPHPYLIIWIECVKRSNFNGVRADPEPQKGWLDQDADLSLACDVLDELQTEHKAIEEARKTSMEQAKARDQGLLQS